MPKGTDVLTRTRDRIRSLPRVDFVALLGDNFYGARPDDVPDKTFKLFDLCKISPNIPHYAILGNHDYRGNYRLQLEYSKTDPAWQMPARYYAKIFMSGDVSICALFIDTELIHTRTNLDQQMAWMKQALMSPQCQEANWRIVNGHRNVYTAGIYSKESRVRDAVLPILHQGNVHVYYSGHEHNLQVLQDDNKTVYAIAGKINQGMKPIQYQHEFLKWHAHEVPGFIYTQASSKELNISMYGTDQGFLTSISVVRS